MKIGNALRKLDPMIAATATLGVLSAFAVLLTWLALTDIWHSEPDLALEWRVVQIGFRDHSSLSCRDACAVGQSDSSAWPRPLAGNRFGDAGFGGVARERGRKPPRVEGCDFVTRPKTPGRGRVRSIRSVADGHYGRVMHCRGAVRNRLLVTVTAGAPSQRTTGAGAGPLR